MIANARASDTLELAGREFKCCKVQVSAIVKKGARLEGKALFELEEGGQTEVALQQRRHIELE